MGTKQCDRGQQAVAESTEQTFLSNVATKANVSCSYTLASVPGEMQLQ